MKPSSPVLIDSREREARPWLPVVGLPGAVYVGPDGEALRLDQDGTLERWPPFQARSVAFWPAAQRRQRW